MGENKIVPKRRALFLDRDGILNKAIVVKGLPYSPRTIHEIKLTEDIFDRLQEIKLAGNLLIGITNQPDVARGLMTVSQANAINDFVKESLSLDQIFTCYHDEQDHCSCRKPKPGLVHEAARQYNIEIKESVVIGDRWRDMELANALEIPGLLVDYNYSEIQSISCTRKFASVADALDYVANSIFTT